MNGSVPVCSFYTNKTCWEKNIDTMNSAYATLMIPVEVMMALFMIIGVIGNAIVLIVYIFKRNKRSAHIFIMHLACIDLIACSIIHPYIIYKIFHYHDQTWVAACKIFEFFVHLNLFASGTALLTVAIDRYLAICKPIFYIRFYAHVVKLIVTTSIVSVGVSLPLLEFYGTRPTKYEYDHLMIVSYRCDYSEKHRSSSMMTFSVFVMVLFLVEVSAMSILYKNVAVVAYKARRAVGPLSNAHILAGFNSATTSTGIYNNPKQNSNKAALQTTKTDSSIYSIATTETHQCLKTNTTYDDGLKRTNSNQLFSTDMQDSLYHKSGKHNRKQGTSYRNGNNKLTKTASSSLASQLKAAKVLFLVTAIFFLSWMPFFILRICHTLNPNYWVRDTKIEVVAENLLNHFFYINNAVNPIVYTLINKNFRQDCMKIFKKQFCRTNN